MRYMILLLGLIVSLAFQASQTPANLIVNGSFEQASVTPPSYQDLPPGSTAIKGWTATGHIDYVAGLWQASDGKHSLDLEGSACNTRSTTDCLGGVKQTFATVAGQKYDVTFDLAGNPFGAPAVKTLKVSAAGAPQNFTFTVTGHNAASMGWKTQHWTFTAAAATTTLEFDSADSVTNLSGWGPVLDNVIVMASSTK
ncbi:MAG TPA: choice-of-anchor C family protein [Candidatus Acidoferrum sp.]|nr:choice-of-anchor C family protein [Candidatus Acidoferrum sp.]